jgi:hypothetical protein
MAHGFVAEKTSHNTRYTASSLTFGSLLGPRQNVLIRTFCSDTFGSTLSRFTKRRVPETLYAILV